MNRIESISSPFLVPRLVHEEVLPRSRRRWEVYFSLSIIIFCLIMHHNISFIMLLIRYLIARSHANFFSPEIIVPSL